MKSRTLYTAASLLALEPAGAAHVLMPPAAEAAALAAARSSGSPEVMQRFLEEFPDSPFVGEVFGQLLQADSALSIAAEDGIIWRIYGEGGGGGVGGGGGGDRGGGGDGGRTIGVTPQNVAPPSQQRAPTTRAARRSAQQVERATERFSGRVQRCSVDDTDVELNRCIANALEGYASDLDRNPVALPQAPAATPSRPATRSVPAIVRRTAAAVRAAPTAQVARQAVRAAVQEVRKSIELITVEDEPEVAEIITRAGSTVAEAIELAENKLEEAIGL